VAALGAVTGNQAVQQVRAGLKGSPGPSGRSETNRIAATRRHEVIPFKTDGLISIPLRHLP